MSGMSHDVLNDGVAGVGRVVSSENEANRPVEVRACAVLRGFVPIDIRKEDT